MESKFNLTLVDSSQILAERPMIEAARILQDDTGSIHLFDLEVRTSMVIWLRSKLLAWTYSEASTPLLSFPIKAQFAVSDERDSSRCWFHMHDMGY